MNTKICKQCAVEKELSEFYKVSVNSDITFGKCKECIKENVRANRSKNIDYYLAYDKARANRPDRVAARIAYSKTDAGIKNSNSAKYKWSSLNQIKRGASYIVNNAVRDGKLIKLKTCQSCGKSPKRIEGHHCDYSKPLEVIWFCSKCHREWHKHNSVLNGD